MLRLKLIPKFARLLSDPGLRSPNFPSPDCLQYRCLATSSSGTRGHGRGGSGASRGGRSEGETGGSEKGKTEDDDFLTKYLQQGAASDAQFIDHFFSDRGEQRGSNRQPRYGRGVGRIGRSGLGRGGSVGRGARAGPGSVGRPGWADDGDRTEQDDAKRLAGGAVDEEDSKIKHALEKALEEAAADDKVEEDDVEEEEKEEEVKSIYTGFIDPKYDDLLKERKMQLKRLRYKDKAYMPTKFDDEEEDENLDDLDKDSDDEKDKRKRPVDVKGRAVLASSDEEGSEADDEVDEEEWETISGMDNEEFEKHLRHRENAKALCKEYMARIDALGDKVEDKQEVRKVQDTILKKWRAHYNIPRLVTPLEKEEMWQRHKTDPQTWTVDKLAEEYNVCKARVHAILWLWDLRKDGGETKSAEEENKEYLDSLAFDESGKPCLPPHMGEDKWVTAWVTKPNYKIMPEDWEGSVRPEEEAIEEASAKEEAMMLDEFVRRMEFNKLQMAGLVKQHPHSRRRPPEGWTYLVEKLGPEGKRGKRGGVKFVATADGKHRKLNDLEKLFLKREAVRPRRCIL